VVNLTGPHAPDLSVNRRSIRRYDKPAVRQLLIDAAPALGTAPPPEEDKETAASTPTGGYFWLCKIPADDPVVADPTLDSLGGDLAGWWTMNRAGVRVSTCGSFGPDLGDKSLPIGSGWGLGLQEAISAWRCAAWTAARADTTGADSPGVVQARPSDEVILKYV